MCDRKFYVKDIVLKSSKDIETHTIAIKAAKRNLEKQCSDAQFEIDEDEFDKEISHNLIR